MDARRCGTVLLSQQTPLYASLSMSPDGSVGMLLCSRVHCSSWQWSNPSELVPTPGSASSAGSAWAWTQPPATGKQTPRCQPPHPPISTLLPGDPCQPTGAPQTSPVPPTGIPLGTGRPPCLPGSLQGSTPQVQPPCSLVNGMLQKCMPHISTQKESSRIVTIL